MSEIIAPLLAPEKWYAKFEHVQYSRPNFEEALSPLNSLSFEPSAVDKERRARKILRKLLEGQADINEDLADENDALQYNLKALLNLLLAKDRQLENLSTTAASSVMLSAGRHSPRWEPLTRTCARLGVTMMRRAWWRWKSRAVGVGLRNTVRIAAAGRVLDLVQAVFRRRKTAMWRLLKVPKAFVRLLRMITGKLLTAGFDGLNHYIQTCNLIHTRAAVRLHLSLSVLSLKCVRSPFHLLCSPTSTRASALKCLSRVLKSGRSRLMRRWKSFASSQTIRKLRDDKTATISKVTDFSKRFLKLNQLCSIFSRRCKGLVAKKFVYWRFARQTGGKATSGRLFAGMDTLRVLFAKRLRKQAWSRLATKASSLLPRVLKSVFLPRMHTGFLRFALHSQSGSHFEKKERLSKLDSEVEFLQEELTVAVKEKEKAEQRLAQASKKNGELQANLAEVEAEMEGLRTSLRETTTKAERVRAEADREKVAWAQELKKVAEESATVKAAQSRLEGQYAQCMHEKAKLMALENEQRKQLISMTGTVDSLAEERDNLHERLIAAEQALSQMKSQSNPRKESQLEARIKDLESSLQTTQLTLESKLSQKQKEVSSLQQLCQDMRTQVELSQEQSVSSGDREKLKRLTKENAQLSGRLEELQREQTMAKATNSQLSSQVLKLNKEIADLKRSELELLGGDLKRIQTERDRLIMAVKEQQKNTQFASDMQIRAVQEQNRRLQEEVQRLQGAGKTDGDSAILHGEIKRLQNILSETQAELEECRSQAVESREELATLSHELENYGSVFEAMDRKVVETEASEREALRARDQAIQELAIMKQRYFTYLNPA